MEINLAAYFCSLTSKLANFYMSKANPEAIVQTAISPNLYIIVYFQISSPLNETSGANSFNPFNQFVVSGS